MSQHRLELPAATASEPVVFDAEPVDLVPAPASGPADRDEKGVFVSGSRVGRPKGSMNKITTTMREEAVRYFEENGEQANPLLILARIAASENTPAALRVQAADRLLRYILPRKISVEMDAPDEGTIVAERTIITERLKAFFGSGPEIGSASR